MSDVKEKIEGKVEVFLFGRKTFFTYVADKILCVRDEEGDVAFEVDAELSDHVAARGAILAFARGLNRGLVLGRAQKAQELRMALEL